MKLIGNILISILFFTGNVYAQTLTIKELQQAYNFNDKNNVPILEQKGFVPFPVIAAEHMESYGFINNKDERVTVSYLTGYEAEGGQHVVLEYSLITWQAYKQLIASAKAMNFTYDASNKHYILRNGTYIYRKIEPLGKSGRYYHIRYTSHTGKETSPVPVISTGIPAGPPEEPMIAKGMYEHMADSLRYTSGIPATGNCDTTDIFWRVVKLKEKAILGLLLNLDDTTETQVIDSVFHEWYTVADIAYIALGEIIDSLPMPGPAKEWSVDRKDHSYNNYRHYLYTNAMHRKAFKKAVTDWYYDHRDDLAWKDNDHLLITGCQKKHPNGGRYILKKSK